MDDDEQDKARANRTGRMQAAGLMMQGMSVGMMDICEEAQKEKWSQEMVFASGCAAQLQSFIGGNLAACDPVPLMRLCAVMNRQRKHFRDRLERLEEAGAPDEQLEALRAVLGILPKSAAMLDKWADEIEAARKEEE